MRTRLSSHQTFSTRVLLPAVWIAIFGLGPFAIFLSQPDASDPSVKWKYLLAWIAGFAFLYWTCIRLKAVSVDSKCLYVSNYLKEISIPLSEISDVTESVRLGFHPVTIHLKWPSEFGDKIIFMPKVRFFAFLSSHPVVSEFEGVDKNKRRGGQVQ